MGPVFRKHDAQFYRGSTILVMPGPEPGIHVFDLVRCLKTWMAATRAAMTMKGDSIGPEFDVMSDALEHRALHVSRPVLPS